MTEGFVKIIGRPAAGQSPNTQTEESDMAHGDKKHFGKGTHGKGSGVGAMTELEADTVGENEILSNRDKKQHSKQRGQDGNAIKTEQRQDHSANRRP